MVLLEDMLKKERSWILASPDFELGADILASLTQQIERRLTHEPLAYIRGFSEFYGRRFAVDKRVLEPRPESEAMIEQLMSLPLQNGMTLADVGTGSGALGITAKLVRPELQITLIDTMADALEVAKINAEAHKTDVKIVKNDLLSEQPAYDIILANLPYVPDDYAINQAATHEPAVALFGGDDGLDLYRKMFGQLAATPAQFVLTEALLFQHDDLDKIALGAGYTRVSEDDFIQVFEFKK